MELLKDLLVGIGSMALIAIWIIIVLVIVMKYPWMAIGASVISLAIVAGQAFRS